MYDTPQDLTEWITQHHPCPAARRFLQKHTTLKEAWKTCANPHWMIIALQRTMPEETATARTLANWLASHTPNANYDFMPPWSAAHFALTGSQVSQQDTAGYLRSIIDPFQDPWPASNNT